MRVKVFATALSAAALLAAVQNPSVSAQSTGGQSQNNKPKTVTVAVQPGDTLSSIADANQTTYVRLFDANAQIADPDVIQPGDNIRVPGPNEQLPDRPLPVAPPAPVSAAAYTPATATGSAYRSAATPNYTAGNGSTWDQLAQCEAGGNWSTSTGNGFYGGLQFTMSSWHAAGGSGSPNEASRDEQIARAQALQQRQGWGAWPACSAKLGLR